MILQKNTLNWVKSDTFSIESNPQQNVIHWCSMKNKNNQKNTDAHIHALSSILICGPTFIGYLLYYYNASTLLIQVINQKKFPLEALQGQEFMCLE